MNVAKWALLALLALPFLELAAFVAVATAIGFGWALSLVLAGSLIGVLILRHAGSTRIAQMRVVLKQGSFIALQADRSGGHLLVAGILLLIPGFITDVAALFLLIPPLLQALRVASRDGTASGRNDGVVDLAPEQWHQVPDPSRPDRHRDKHER